jgi:hypothetical protein
MSMICAIQPLGVSEDLAPSEADSGDLPSRKPVLLTRVLPALFLRLVPVVAIEFDGDDPAVVQDEEVRPDTVVRLLQERLRRERQPRLSEPVVDRYLDGCQEVRPTAFEPGRVTERRGHWDVIERRRDRRRMRLKKTSADLTGNRRSREARA